MIVFTMGLISLENDKSWTQKNENHRDYFPIDSILVVDLIQIADTGGRFSLHDEL